MYHCDLCGAEKSEDCICTEHQKEAYSRQASSFHDAIGGWRKNNEFLKNEFTQSKARIRELEEQRRQTYIAICNITADRDNTTAKIRRRLFNITDEIAQHMADEKALSDKSNQSDTGESDGFC